MEKRTLSTDESIATLNSCSPGVTEPASLKSVCGWAPSAISRAAESPISVGCQQQQMPAGSFGHTEIRRVDPRAAWP
jgi:hypothetical protein